MTIATAINRSGPYTGNGVTTVFPYDFKIENASHIQVIRATALNVETVLALDTDYTVTGVGDEGGGDVVMLAPLASGLTLTFLLDVPFTQETDLENQGAYYAETVEAAFDLAAQRDLQLLEKMNRAILLPASSDDEGGALAAQLAADITRLGQSADEIDVVAGIKDEVETVAGIADDVALLADVSGVLAGTASAARMDEKLFAGNGVATTWPLDRAPGVAENVLVWIGGAIQDTTDYSVAGTTLTITPAVANGVEIRTLIMTQVTANDVEQMRDETEVARDQAVAVANALPPMAANRMLVDNPAGTARETKTFPQVRDLLGLPTLKSFGAVGDNVANDNAAVDTARLSSAKVIEGEGLIYLVNSKPPSFKKFRNCAFRVGRVLYPAKGFIEADFAAVTNGLMYTHWPQAKVYKVRFQYVVWVNEKESHADGTGRIVKYVSDDGGSTYVEGEYLDAKASGRTLWSAGFDGTSEYLFVRYPTSGGNDVKPYSYEMWKRTAGEDATQNSNGAWTVTPITFPTVTGTGGPWTGTAGANGTQPIMVHDFCVGHSGSIVVGASYQEGAALMRSTNGGTTFAATILAEGSSFEEPTVRYHAASNKYCGFMRNGGGGAPRYWQSLDQLATVQYWTFAANFFNGGPMAYATLTLDLDADGNIHAQATYRNGVDEALGTDDFVSSFYMTGPIASNWPAAATTTVMFIAELPRREHGGASGLGQGGVIVDGKKVMLYQGIEKRTGVIGGLGKGNRVNDIIAITILLEDYGGGAFDIRSDFLRNRASGGQLRKISGIDAYTIPFRDADNWPPPVLIGGKPYLARHPSTLTVPAGGVLDITGLGSGLFTLQGGTVNLDQITASDGFDGQVIGLCTISSASQITVRNNQPVGVADRLMIGANFLLSSAYDLIVLMRFTDSSGAHWRKVSASDNA